MTKEELKEIDPLFQELVKRAIDDDSTEFQLIDSNGAYTTTKVFVRGIKKVIKMFQSLAKTTGLAYAKQVYEEKSDLRLLLAHIQYKQCVKFYENELKTAKSMLSEYKVYVFSGHVFKTILNIPRAEEDMVDYRTLPWKLF